MKIKRGDNVIMQSGKDRGKKGKILRVSENKIIVEGLNLIKRHTRPRQQGQKGQIISKERFVDSSSVALVCKACGQPTRIGYRIQGENKIRICKKCEAET
jgi:large subunit ribosomal protein L24